MFESLYRRHVSAVFEYFAPRVGDDTAEELTAQTFIEAWACRSSFDPVMGTERAWLQGIASNLWRHHSRNDRRRSWSYDGTRLAGSATPADDPLSDDLVADAHRPDITRALALMSADEREVLMLCARADLSYEAIAVVLQMPVDAVRERFSQARTRLAAHLAASLPRGSRG